MSNFERVVALHSKLAGRLKQVESAIEDFPIEVLNEYRYACRALIEAVENQEQPTSDKFIHAESKAYHALLNAYHDLADGLVISLVARLAKLSDQHLAETIQVLGDKRRTIVALCNELDEKISESREKPELRIEIYEQGIYDKYLVELLEHCKYLKLATQDIFGLAAINDKEKKELKKQSVANKQLAFYGVTIGIIGTCVGIVAIFL